MVALLFLDTVPRLLPRGKPASAVHLDGFRSEPSDSWPDSGRMKWELVTASFTVWERSLLSHLLVGTWIQPAHLTFPGLGWGRNLAFNTLDKACSSRFSDIILRLASLAEQGRRQCSKAGERRSSCSLASPSVHVLACSRVCWKRLLCRRLFYAGEIEWSRNLLLRDGGLGCRSLHPVTMWTHKLERIQWGPHLNGDALHNAIHVCASIVLASRLACIYLPLTPVFIYHSLWPFANQPFASLIFHISSLSFSLHPSDPQKSLWTPQTSRYCLVCFLHTAPKTGRLSFHACLLTGKWSSGL